jgi:hypothetical protein
VHCQTTSPIPLNAKVAPPSTKAGLLLPYPQQIIIFKSLKRFEKLKIDYSKQYRIGIARRDTIQQLRQTTAEKDSIIGRYQKGIWKEGVDKQTALKDVASWKHKARARNTRFLTLLTLVLAGFTYEKIH